jgi:hypothetical protein
MTDAGYAFKERIDFKKAFRHLYQPSAKEVVQIDVPTMNYVMVDGEGDPNTTQAFSDAVEAIFAVSYTVKFMVKKSKKAVDYAVMPSEGLWWVDDGKFSMEDKDAWQWTAMIMQPEYVTEKMYKEALELVKKKKTSLRCLECGLKLQ